MLVMRTTENLTDPVGELVSTEQPVGFCNLALAVNPLGLYGVKPRTLLGHKTKLTILTPAFSPLFLTQRLCLPSQRLTSLETCQLALSQIRSRTFLPAASSFSKLHSRNRVVMELTGLPSTNLSHVSSPNSGR